MILKKIYFLLIVLFFGNLCYAQQAKVYTVKEYAKNPVWISMIKDTSVNFFEAERAFNIYFEHHPKPNGENEQIGEYAKSEKYPSPKEKRKMQDQDHMRIEVKKYERWHDRMFPYVKADGTILTPTQRLEVWKDNKATK